jgi:hypothetical protein
MAVAAPISVRRSSGVSIRSSAALAASRAPSIRPPTARVGMTMSFISESWISPPRSTFAGRVSETFIAQAPPSSASATIATNRAWVKCPPPSARRAVR